MTIKRGVWKNKKGDSSLLKLAVGIPLGLIIVAYLLFGVGIPALYDVDTRGWGSAPGNVTFNATNGTWGYQNGSIWEISSVNYEDTAATTLYMLLPLFGVLAIVVLLIVLLQRRTG